MDLVEIALKWNELGRWGNEGNVLYPHMTFIQKLHYLHKTWGVWFCFNEKEVDDIFYGRKKLFD